jgi:hypothetical protein
VEREVFGSFLLLSHTVEYTRRWKVRVKFSLPFQSKKKKKKLEMQAQAQQKREPATFDLHVSREPADVPGTFEISVPAVVSLPPASAIQGGSSVDPNTPGEGWVYRQFLQIIQHLHGQAARALENDIQEKPDLWRDFEQQVGGASVPLSASSLPAAGDLSNGDTILEPYRALANALAQYIQQTRYADAENVGLLLASMVNQVGMIAQDIHSFREQVRDVIAKNLGILQRSYKIIVNTTLKCLQEVNETCQPEEMSLNEVSAFQQLKKDTQRSYDACHTLEIRLQEFLKELDPEDREAILLLQETDSQKTDPMGELILFRTKMLVDECLSKWDSNPDFQALIKIKENFERTKTQPESIERTLALKSLHDHLKSLDTSLRQRAGYCHRLRELRNEIEQQAQKCLHIREQAETRLNPHLAREQAKKDKCTQKTQALLRKFIQKIEAIDAQVKQHTQEAIFVLCQDTSVRIQLKQTARKQAQQFLANTLSVHADSLGPLAPRVDEFLTGLDDAFSDVVAAQTEIEHAADRQFLQQLSTTLTFVQTPRSPHDSSGAFLSVAPSKTPMKTAPY